MKHLRLLFPILLLSLPALAAPTTIAPRTMPAISASLMAPAGLVTVVRSVPGYLAHAHLLAGARPLFAAVDLSGVLSSLLTPTNIAGAIVAILGLVAGWLHLSDRRKRLIALAAYYGFHIVEDLDAQGLLHVSKVEEGLSQVDAWMRANGWRPLKPGETAIAKQVFSAESGKKQVAKQLAASAKPAPASPPVPAAG